MTHNAKLLKMQVALQVLKLNGLSMNPPLLHLPMDSIKTAEMQRLLFMI
jgi:hypothetical protein